MDRWHSLTGIVPGIVPRERIDYIGAQGYFPGCTADTFRNPFIQTPGQGNIGRERKVYNRYAGVLAEQDTQPFCLFYIVQDIGKLATCYGVCLGCGCPPDNTQHIRREMDDGLAVRLERGISERGVDRGIIQCLHSCVLRRAG
jgi:hypothetical protein